eukprot:TRINITY_DN36993_c0_g1_i1.p1 TRINITY_DN36993_c0_g1~~TRINITY_DN36993_c0_g1_i1.p1  ORF type:complete len:424 (+),score=21.62 TRINITY_DN36993_c0_g1_i1:76-1347(+)
MSDSQYVPSSTVVLDFGSSISKVGFGGLSSPHAIFPTILGQPRHPGVTGILLGHPTDSFIGHEAAAHAGLLNITHPVVRGAWTSLDHVELLTHHALFRHLHAPPESHRVLFAHRANLPAADQEALLQVLFERLNTPAVCLRTHPLLSLFGAGRATGLVIDSGAAATHAVPVYNGVELPHACTSAAFGGEDITDRLVAALRADGVPVSCAADRDLVERAKRVACFVPETPDDDVAASVASHSPTPLALPDGSILSLGQSAVLVPRTAPVTCAALGALALQTLSRPLAADLARSVVIAGGNTLLAGFAPRLRSELSGHLNASLSRGTGSRASIAAGSSDVSASVPAASPPLRAEDIAGGAGGVGRPETNRFGANTPVPVSVVAQDARQYQAWIGGSALASLSTFPSLCHTKREYDEHGTSVLYHK